MKRILSICAVALVLCMSAAPAFAVEPELAAQACYPTAVTRTEDGLAGVLTLKLDSVKALPTPAAPPAATSRATPSPPTTPAR